MNKTIAITAIIIVILVAGGLIFYVGQNMSSDNNVASNSITSTDNSGQTDTTQVQTSKHGIPFVVTNTNVAPTDNTAVVNGAVIPNGTFTSYWYEYSISSDFSSKMTNSSQTIGSGYQSIPAPGYITGLVKDTKYYFRLVAENQDGRTVGAEYSFQTTHGISAPVGSIPTAKTLAASGVSKIVAKLNGEVTPNQTSTQFWFEYGKTANLGNTTALQSAGNGTAKIPAFLSLSDLDSATTYYFRLNAQNQFGTVNGSILSFKTLGPPSATAPSVKTVSAINFSTSIATLRGTLNPNGAETIYWFEYSIDPAFVSSLLNSTVKKSVSASSGEMSISTSISGLSSKTNYYFRVVAQNSFGITNGDRMTFKAK